MIPEYLRWLKFWAADEKAREFYETGPMKTKGFTFIELIVAMTLLLILSSVATTTAYNFIQAVTKLKTQYLNLKQNIAVLYTDLALAKMNYETDLALTPGAETDIQNWNTWANQNENPLLIQQLINPDPALPIPLKPLTPGSRSYLPKSRTVQETTYNNGIPVLNTVTVQITDMDSLLKAYLLTDDGTTAGNPVATITVGKILDVQGQGRPTLPIIDWRGGTLQEIVFPSNLVTP
jgi:prepilin-type N-terminal cleavage/methylation domain-containing protein